MLNLWFHPGEVLLGLCLGVSCQVASQGVGLLEVVQGAELVLVKFQNGLLLWQWVLHG